MARAVAPGSWSKAASRAPAAAKDSATNVRSSIDATRPSVAAGGEQVAVAWPTPPGSGVTTGARASRPAWPGTGRRSGDGARRLRLAHPQLRQPAHGSSLPYRGANSGCSHARSSSRTRCSVWRISHVTRIRASQLAAARRQRQRRRPRVLGLHRQQVAQDVTSGRVQPLAARPQRRLTHRRRTPRSPASRACGRHASSISSASSRGATASSRTRTAG